MNAHRPTFFPGLNWIGSLAIGLAVLMPGEVGGTGSWLISGNQATAAVGLLILLPDGTVMAENNPNTTSSGYGYVWYRLTPDANGHYVNGTWSDGGAMNYTRLFHSSQVLPNGKLFVAGGEYGTGGATAEVFDPQANTWTPVNPPVSLLDPSQVSPVLSTNNPNGGLQGFYDSESMTLPNGSVLVGPVGPRNYGGTLIYHPLSNSWSNGPTTFRGGYQDEASWVKLPDGSILTVDPFGTNSERYIPALAKWISDTNVPVALYSPVGGEIGPALLLPNGKAFFLGGSGHTAIYTPSGTTNFGSWVAGPDIPDGLTAADAPAAMMVNGRILCAVSGAPYLDGNGKEQFPSPTSFFEYDYTIGTTGQFAQVSGPTGLTDDTPAFETAFLMLPDASVMFCDSTEAHDPFPSGAKLYFYYPDNNAQVTFGKQPTITSIASNPDGSYHLVGTGLNGLSAGAAYGDDKQMDSSYPLVEFIDTGNGQIAYGRTYNWSTNGVQTGSAVESVDFMPPANLSLKTYNMAVTASGITSAPVAFSFVSPSPLEMCPGDSGSLSAIPSSLPATYQWLFNGNPISGQTGSTLNFVSATTNQSGLYALRVTTSGGTFTSEPVQVSVGVWVLDPPSPTNSATLCQPKTLSLTAQGKGSLTAQWFRNGIPVFINSRITTNMVAQPAGGTTLSLSFSNVRYEDDGTYTVVLTDDCGTITTAPFTMRVIPNPPWVQVATNGPPPRYEAAMTYDAFRHVTVLFGGMTYNPTGSPVLGDTWEFDGTNWTQRFSGLPSPAARAQAQMVYDPVRLHTVLFGGETYTNGQFHISLDTWEWDGINWHQIITSNTPDWTQPDQFGACFDGARNEMLIFGGIGTAGRVSELWGFDGTNWTRKNPTGAAPVAAGTTLMTFDSLRNVVVLLGANSQAYPSPYTAAAVWEWDGSAWHEKPQSGQVFAGASAIDGLTFDTFRNESVLYADVFGIIDGVLSSSYTPYPYGYRFIWRWDGAHWQADPPTPTVGGAALQLYPSMCFDPLRNAIVLFGGEDSNSSLDTNNTYEMLYLDDPTMLAQPNIEASLIGQKVQLSVLAAGAPPIAYQWSKDGAILTDNGRISGSQSNTLTINPALVADSGLYLVTMNNICGAGISQPMTINVAAGPDILAIALSGHGGGLSQNVVITWGDVNATLQSSTNIIGPWTAITGATSPYTYTINPALPAQFFRLSHP